MTQKVSLDLVDLGGGQLAGLRNKIINGKMEIAQRGTSFASAFGNFLVDRYTALATGVTAVCDASQNSDVPSSNEFQSSLRLTVTTADASIVAADFASIDQRLEGFNVRDLIGKTFTLSFWVRSSKTGIHCVGLRNSGNDRSYILEYTVNSANTWEQKSVTVSGGLITAGTWDWTTGVGLRVVFALAAGSNFHTTAGLWQTGNFRSTASQVNCLDTIGNIFAITGVQLEVGSVATPFEHRPYGMELALCQRYYYRTDQAANNIVLAEAGQWLTATTGQAQLVFPVNMRIPPTALEQTGTAIDYKAISASGSGLILTSAPTLSIAGTRSAAVAFTYSTGGQTAGDATRLAANGASAYLGFSAEF